MKREFKLPNYLEDVVRDQFTAGKRLGTGDILADDWQQCEMADVRLRDAQGAEFRAKLLFQARLGNGIEVRNVTYEEL